MSVRLGNVIDSRGSVLQVFKRQIAEGGPVTVTDSYMERYFMTVEEACHLILQASELGKGREVFVLEMGAPVRISDLAENFIRLHGLRPGKDIAIVYSGARPGEKLLEQLNTEDEVIQATNNEKIRMMSGVGMPEPTMHMYLSRLRDCCGRRNREELISLFNEIVPEYEPGHEI